ncbi:AI-2E family transporter [Carboxylicivirga mesophila]|uniref:AI-2E family transporter n=1 Tax=Carboxylicivirga mesophila TaxID=1166478 RepID=A0ABS5K8F8_9BACT|nr:AI-2E family transporter [Carboxylicivirga mesophila]MBS2210663.1 AI-2E family transporter [Carboxylicivirga mesophila]
MVERLKYMFGLLLAIIAIVVIWYFRAVVSFLIVSAVISLVARPIFDIIQKIRIRSWKPSNSVSALLTVLTLWVFILAFFRISVPFIVKEIHFLSNVDLDVVFARAERLLGSLLQPLRDTEFGKAGLDVVEGQIKETALTFFDFSRLRGIFASLAGFLGGLFIFAFSVSFITFFFLKEEWLIIEGLLLFIPSHYENALKHMLASIKTLLRRYFIGIIVQITLISVFVTLGLAMIGLEMQHAVIIGLFSGFVNVIPYMGPLIGAFFGFLVALVAFVQTSTPPEFVPFMLGVILVFVIVQLLDNIVFQPFIFSASVRAHPLEIFILILMAGYMSGIIGMFLAIPVYTIIRVIAKEFFYNYKLVQKLTQKIKE